MSPARNRRPNRISRGFADSLTKTAGEMRSTSTSTFHAFPKLDSARLFKGYLKPFPHTANLSALALDG